MVVLVQQGAGGAQVVGVDVVEAGWAFVVVAFGGNGQWGAAQVDGFPEGLAVVVVFAQELALGVVDEAGGMALTVLAMRWPRPL
ncbi:hypothetical protein MoryE10_24170 [Methylogaea oryzae]|uniref:Uncharacterized protein n=1 Tax=Methylogaea oryzae TaxID=1295382 RepID=A0A8D4VQB1_9GAMM|nr:hypothetical protein MoryE10_24170 [Methylogaea oryzae]